MIPLKVIILFADIDPFRSAAGIFKLGDRKADCAVIRSGGRIDDIMLLQALVKIDDDIIVDAKGTDSAYTVADQSLDLITGNHLSLAAKTFLIFFVVDAGHTFSQDQDRSFPLNEGQGFCDHTRFTAESLCCFGDSCAALLGDDDMIGIALMFEI